MKKFIKDMGVGQPKTLVEALALSAAKFAVTVLIGFGISAGFWWAFTHDETNQENINNGWAKWEQPQPEK